jgi:Mg2+/citrate symporter
MIRIKLWLYAIGGFVVAVLGAWFVGRREGKKVAEYEESQRRLDVMKEAHEVQDEVRKLSDDDMRRALGRWMRDP